MPEHEYPKPPPVLRPSPIHLPRHARRAILVAFVLVVVGVSLFLAEGLLKVDSNPTFLVAMGLGYTGGIGVVILMQRNQAPSAREMVSSLLWAASIVGLSVGICLLPRSLLPAYETAMCLAVVAWVAKKCRDLWLICDANDELGEKTYRRLARTFWLCGLPLAAMSCGMAAILAFKRGGHG